MNEPRQWNDITGKDVRGLLRRPVVAPAWAAGIGGLLVFALGSVAGGGTEPATGPVATATEQVTEQVTVTATETITETDDAGASEVAVERRRLNTVKANLNDRKDQLDERKDRLDQRAAELDEQEAAVAAAPEPEAEPETFFYENCDAARADGAAPVYEGDPGYGPHLDADNDGIGCDT